MHTTCYSYYTVIQIARKKPEIKEEVPMKVRLQFVDELNIGLDHERKFAVDFKKSVTEKRRHRWWKNTNKYEHWWCRAPTRRVAISLDLI